MGCLGFVFLLPFKEEKDKFTHIFPEGKRVVLGMERLDVFGL